jgi:hypothetical protein
MAGYRSWPGEQLFRLAYDPRGLVTVSSDTDELVMVIADFITDPLWELSDAAIRLLRGLGDEVDIELQSEPDIYRWEIRQTGDRLRIEIAFIDGPRTMHNTGERVFDTHCRTREFTGQVLSALDQAWRDLGQDGYLAATRNQLPSENHTQLRSLSRKKA